MSFERGERKAKSLGRREAAGSGRQQLCRRKQCAAKRLTSYTSTFFDANERLDGPHNDLNLDPIRLASELRHSSRDNLVDDRLERLDIGSVLSESDKGVSDDMRWEGIGA